MLESTKRAAGAFLVKIPHKGEAAPGSLDSWHLDVPAWGQPIQGLGQGRHRLLSPCSGLVSTPGEPGRGLLSVFLLAISPAQLQPLQTAIAVSTCATAGDDQNGSGGFLFCSLTLIGCLLFPLECHCVSAEWVVPPMQRAKRCCCCL